MRPAFSEATAVSSPIVPETMMNGMSRPVFGEHAQRIGRRECRHAVVGHHDVPGVGSRGRRSSLRPCRRGARLLRSRLFDSSWSRSSASAAESSTIRTRIVLAMAVKYRHRTDYRCSLPSRYRPCSDARGAQNCVRCSTAGARHRPIHERCASVGRVSRAGHEGSRRIGSSLRWRLPLLIAGLIARGGRDVSRRRVPGGAGRSSARRIGACGGGRESGRRPLRPVFAAATLAIPPAGIRSGSSFDFSTSRPTRRARRHAIGLGHVSEHRSASHRRVERHGRAAADVRHARRRPTRCSPGGARPICKRNRPAPQGRRGAFTVKRPSKSSRAPPRPTIDRRTRLAVGSSCGGPRRRHRLPTCSTGSSARMRGLPSAIAAEMCGRISRVDRATANQSRAARAPPRRSPPTACVTSAHWLPSAERLEHLGRLLRMPSVLAPARAFLQRMLLIAVAFLVYSRRRLSRFVSARITSPLSTLTAASEAIAAGEYSRRVPVNRGTKSAG